MYLQLLLFFCNLLKEHAKDKININRLLRMAAGAISYF